MLNGWVFTMLETFVGLFMLGLGTYGVAKALMNREYISTVMGSMEMAKRRHSSRLTMAAGNKKKNKASVKNPLVMTGGEDLLDLPPRQENSLDDQMADALGDTVLVHTNFDDREGDKTCELNDADRRIWNAAKSLSNTDNIMMYASEDEMSCGKSHSESVVTIPMSTSIMADLQRLYDEQGDGVSDSDSVESGKNLRHLFDDGDVEVHPIPRSSRHDDYPSSFKAQIPLSHAWNTRTHDWYYSRSCWAWWSVGNSSRCSNARCALGCDISWHILSHINFCDGGLCRFIWKNVQVAG
jgi:hypothetical protein